MSNTHYYQGFFRPKNPQKYVGNPKRIVMRSSWEFRVACYFDNNPNVLSWSSEELVVPYRKPTDGLIHRYFPDFIAKIRDKEGIVKTYMIEVKPLSQSKPPEIKPRKRKSTLLNESVTYAINQAKWDSAKEFCRKKGWIFLVLTEKELGIV